MELFKVYAQYNQWMNNSLYEKCIALGQSAIEKDQGAFFGSILGTLNHLVIGDVFWLARCSGDKSVLALEDAQGQPLKITGLDQILYRDINELFAVRQRLDRQILAYINSLSNDTANSMISYKTSKGESKENPLNVILLHWFNHQTHHRGQVTTLLNQQGIDPGLTDLIYIKDLV